LEPSTTAKKIWISLFILMYPSFEAKSNKIDVQLEKKMFVQVSDRIPAMSYCESFQEYCIFIVFYSPVVVAVIEKAFSLVPPNIFVVYTVNLTVIF
jgi:hypothetical protein